MSALKMEGSPVTFDIADSCKGCCIGCCMSDNAAIYVNGRYEVEKFDYKKSQDPEKDYKKTIKRIKRALGEAFESIKEISAVDLENYNKLTLKDIKRLNEQIAYFQNKLPKSGSSDSEK